MAGYVSGDVARDAREPRGGGEGYSIDPWVERCGPAPHTLTLFKTKIANFPTLFKTEFRFFDTLFKTFNPKPKTNFAVV